MVSEKDMFQKLEESSGNVIGFKLSGKLTDTDYQEVIPQFEESIEKWGKIRILWILEDFHGWEAKAAWDDLKYWLKFKDDIERCALIGDEKWEEWMTKLAKPFMRTKVKYFDQSHMQEAWDWAREE